MNEKHNSELYHLQGPNEAVCQICHRRCVLHEGEVGLCGNRKALLDNHDNLSIVPKKITEIDAMCIDPIEKKPLYHFLPGENVLSLGLKGCNMNCPFCQNYSLSYAKDRDDQTEFARVHPGAERVKDLLTEEAAQEKKDRRFMGIAFTYSEPLTWFEFLWDTAQKSCDLGFTNILVSNGMISEQALNQITKMLQGVNVDIKAFNSDTYRTLGGDLGTVTATVQTLIERNVHVELTYLVIPEFNDSEKELKSFIRWVKGMSEDIPVHFSRYFPSFKMTNPPTSVKALKEIYYQAKKDLNHVYLGNIGDAKFQTTYCSCCDKAVIERSYFEIKKNIKTGECASCGQKLPGVFSL